MSANLKINKYMEEIKTIIGEAVGEASMCWSEIPKGIFESDKASKIVDKVLEKLTALINDKDKTIAELYERLQDVEDTHIRLGDLSAWRKVGIEKGYWAYFKDIIIKEYLGTDEGSVYQDYTKLKKNIIKEEQERIFDYINEYYAENDASVSRNLANIIFNKSL
jgi:ATP-dependent exoDNAse (exonuclease V) beta subunit